jgi:hypothetical protein
VNNANNATSEESTLLVMMNHDVAMKRLLTAQNFLVASLLKKPATNVCTDEHVELSKKICRAF